MKFLRLLLLSTCTLGPLRADPGSVLGPPRIDMVQEPFVFRDGSTYYLTGTLGTPDAAGRPDFEYNRGVPLWKSHDLKTWEPLGFAWDRQASLEKGRPKIGIWLDWSAPGEKLDGLLAQATTSPKIYRIGSDWFLVCAMNNQNILLQKSSSAGPEGPYEDFAYLVTRGGFPSLFQDDDGTVYLVYADGWFAPLAKDLKKLEAAPKPFALASAGPGKGRLFPGERGVSLFKRNGKYHLLAANWEVRNGKPGHDAMLWTADSPAGPYAPSGKILADSGPVTVFQTTDNAWKALPRAAFPSAPTPLDIPSP